MDIKDLTRDVLDIKTLCCTKCKSSKELSNFGVSKNTKCGYDSRCKVCNIKRSNIYNFKNRDKVLANKKKWKLKNRDKHLNDLKNWRSNNKASIKIKNTEYHRNRKLIDSFFKLKGNIRSLISRSFKNQYIRKNTKTANILGCTFLEFKQHLENQFDDKMNWQNRGSYWHMDHIKPISLATNEQELIELNHYTNFQSLEKIANIKKGNKYEY